MKLSKSDLSKIETAAKNTKRVTKLVSLPQELFDQLQSLGLPIPRSTFTISQFLYGDRFNIKRFMLGLTQKKLIKVAAYCLQRLDIHIQKEGTGMYLFIPGRMSTIDAIYNRMQEDKVNPISSVPEYEGDE